MFCVSVFSWVSGLKYLRTDYCIFIQHLCFIYSKVDGEKVPAQVPLPVRRDRLRESQESNKENNTPPTDSSSQYVEKLVAEGFDRQNVIRALQIADNNLRMAREILQEFVPKT